MQKNPSRLPPKSSPVFALAVCPSVRLTVCPSVRLCVRLKCSETKEYAKIFATFLQGYPLKT